jgi:hypothetical protein
LILDDIKWKSKWSCFLSNYGGFIFTLIHCIWNSPWQQKAMRLIFSTG